MAFTNYSDLQTAVADWLERDDLTSNIPDFIRIAEAEIGRDLRIADMLTRSAITVNARQISKPTGFLEGETLRLLTDPVTVLDNIPLYEMNRVRSATTGKPRYFTVHTEIEFDRNPDQSYSGEIIFYKEYDPLETTATNNLLTNHPDIYLYGALKASAPFMMHDERVTLWSQLYVNAVAKANEVAVRERTSGPVVSRVVGRGP